MKNSILRTVLFAALALVSLGVPGTAQITPPRWSARTIELAEALPIQEGGRVKPLSTFADFTLLRLHGKRAIEGTDGVERKPIEWLLDTVLFPQFASRQQLFLVQDAQVIEALGLSLADKDRRDHYSYEELEPGVELLFQRANEVSAIEAKDRSTIQHGTLTLAENVNVFLGLANSGLATLSLFPPVGTVEEEPEWWSGADLVGHAQAGGGLDDQHLKALTELNLLINALEDPVAFEKHMGIVHGRLGGMAEARGEYEKIGLELFYYKGRFMTWALVLFLLSFLVTAFTWIRPEGRALARVAWGLVSLATCTLVLGIVLRCIIRSRPPVSTLYETVIFVTAVGAMVGMFIEYFDRKRLALAVVTFLGTVGMFVANRYELLDKRDTMPSLVAVLDTNFWLATHVTAITIGYSAGMLAAVMASFYIVARALKRADKGFRKSLSRMIYGTLCFGLVFSVIGTILGGIWANDSWGRFWGWDPKENGALLICLSQIAILHGRMAGVLREMGVALATAFGGTVVAFSWWGVNLLGVGLHSYGFTSGIHNALWSYYILQWGIVGLGAWAWLRDGKKSTSKKF